MTGDDNDEEESERTVFNAQGAGGGKPDEDKEKPEDPPAEPEDLPAEEDLEDERTIIRPAGPAAPASPPAEEAEEIPPFDEFESLDEPEPAAEPEPDPPPAPGPDPVAHDEPDDDRTVIRPGPAPAPPPSGQPDEERTIIAPATSAPSNPEDNVDRTIIAPGGSSTPQDTPPPAAAQKAPRLLSGVAIGDVLNHTYEITRFIGRGGMGEVLEGVNISNGQRVAIKVILPAMASDPSVIEMFVKEATVLERLVHPALVKYRGQARDPQLGVFYIVTNYIPGNSLESVIGKLTPEVSQVLDLTRRLAEGLANAHELGAIHRDIAPDNILLEDGKLELAQVIDFGIARDINPDSKTVIGTGFAGKLSFVAPEQLGAFDGDVGPWTDVYSLGLVMLALAQGHAHKLGKSMFEAMEQRKKGIDTSGAPQALRPLLDAMLAYDPAKRLRSMRDVVRRIDAIEAGRSAPASGGGGALGGIGAWWNGLVQSIPDGKVPRAAWIGGGGVLAFLLVGVLAWIVLGGPDTPDADDDDYTRVIPADAIDAVTAQERVNAALATLGCHWIDLQVTGQRGAVSVVATGVAGEPSALTTAILAELADPAVNTDFSGVEAIPSSNCQVMDLLRPVRAEGVNRLSQPSRSSEIERIPDDFQTEALRGQLGARRTVEIAADDSVGQIALFTLERGEVEPVIGQVGRPSEVIPQTYLDRPGVYKLDGVSQIDEEQWEAMVLLEGGPELAAAMDALSQPSGGNFAEVAAAGNIRAYMLWHHVVDDSPN